MKITQKTFLIYGVSQGLGKAIASRVPDTDDLIYGISRSQPNDLQRVNWIKADLSNPTQACNQIKSVIGNDRIDVFIFNVGIWEHTAFTQDYDFSSISASEIQTIINTNVISCIQSIQDLIENLKKSENAKVILIGSTWGLENHNGKELVFSATKFALRGIAHSLREILRNDAIAVSILNLGYLATDYTIDTPIEQILSETAEHLIPLSDVVAAIKFIISTSRATCVKEITMPAMQDLNV